MCATGVDRSKFRQCKDTSFCIRQREPIDNQSEGSQIFKKHHQLFEINYDSLQFSSEAANLVGELSVRNWPLQPKLQFQLSITKDGIIRFLVDENPKLQFYERWRVRDVIQPSALDPLKSNNQLTYNINSDHSLVTLQWQIDLEEGQQKDSVQLQLKPFLLTVYTNSVPVFVVNSRSLMKFEQFRDENPRPTSKRPKMIEGDVVPSQDGKTASDFNTDPNSQSSTLEQEFEDVPAPDADPSTSPYPYDEPGMWSESFGGFTDTRMKGPAAVGVDVEFVGTRHVYGLPEHASSFSLKNTRGKTSDSYNEPFRLFNLDVFEYELDEPMALYGAVPFVMSHSKDRTSACLWLNAAETFVDIDSSDDSNSRNVHWMSESGVIDLYLLPGSSSVRTVFRQYSELTGYHFLPPLFSLGYHQCRWNYKSESDVLSVDQGFDEHDIPYDVLWLDIEHTDGKKYMTWDHSQFPNPIEMQNKLATKGRKMVTIIDPHIKRDSHYIIHTAAESNNYYIQTHDGQVYEGWCWPGSVSYLDFMLENVRSFWRKSLSLKEYVGSTLNLFVWNDMNEPSVFNGPEVTMPKNCRHLFGRVEHRDVHNTYGYYVSMATSQGLIDRSNKRPFVLTRSFFAGYQRFGAVWTGDNAAQWSHLEIASPMLLSLSISAISFSGSDVGGFFGDPTVELLTRWYQTAAYHPFFRAHAHIDTKRREPWLFGEPHTSHIRQAIRRRYQIIPYIYTLFYENHISGMPVMRPIWMEFPSAEEYYSIDSQFMLGNALLIQPVTQPGISNVDISLPKHQHSSSTSITSSPLSVNTVWYLYGSNQQYSGGSSYNIPTPPSSIPVFQLGGTIIPQLWRARRSTKAQSLDPFTIVVALNDNLQASGNLYWDDGESFDYKDKSEFLIINFTFNQNQFTSTVNGKTDESSLYQKVERIVILGLKNNYYKTANVVQNEQNTKVLVINDSDSNQIIIRNPNTYIHIPFTITF